MGQKYTQEMKEQILRMRKDGKTYKQIGAALGKSAGSINSFVFHNDRGGRGKGKRKIEHKIKPTLVSKEPVELPRSQARPMLAIVGDRAEVAKTIRELFS